MKAIKFFMFAVGAMATLSCAKEITPDTNEIPNQNLTKITLSAVSESCDSDEDTKAAFVSYPKIAWVKNDAISILGTNTGNQSFITENAGHSVTFEGMADLEDEKLYALYPYDGAVTLDGNALVNVTVPAVQNATAGNFDPKAYIAIAESNDKESLSFKAIGAFIKFNFQNFDKFDKNVKSVTLMSNTGSIMAGTASKTTLNANGSTSHSTIVSGTGSTFVTLEGPFDLTKAYFMVIRPGTYEGGVTVFIEFEDGTILSRKGANPLFESGKSRNYIRTMILNANYFAEETEPYALYTLGKDIKIGDIVLNKAVNKNAKKITATEANTNVYNQFKNGGIFFMETSGEGSFVLNSNVDVTSDVILIGNNMTSKVLIDMNGKNVNHTAKTVALKNLELDTDAYTNYVFANNNATADADAFILDNCSVTDLVKPLWYVNNKEYSCKKIIMIDTDVELVEAQSPNVNIIDLAKTTSIGNEQVIIENCIFYAPQNSTSRIINNSSNIVSTASLKFNNNTVFNLHSGVNAGVVHMAGASTVEFKNNLFDFWSINDVTTEGKFEYVVRIWKNNPTYDVDNNHYWRRDKNTVESDQLATHGNGSSVVYAVNASSAITSGAYPFTSNVPSAGATR